MKPPKFAFDSLPREFLQVRPRTIKRVDPPSHHRNRAAGVREQPFYVTKACKRAAQQQACHRSRGVVWDFNHGRKSADAERAAAGRDQRMHVDDGLAPVQFLEHWLLSRIAEPFVAVTALQADPVGFQAVESIFDLLE